MTKLKDVGVGEPISEPAEPHTEPPLAVDKQAAPNTVTPPEKSISEEFGAGELISNFKEQAEGLAKRCEEEAAKAKENLHHTAANAFKNLKQHIDQTVKTVGNYAYHKKTEEPTTFKTQLASKRK